MSSFWTARALEFIRTQPDAWLAQLARKLALTCNAVEIADTESQEIYAAWSSLLRALTPVSFGVILCLAAAGACLTAAAWRRLWFLYAIALTYTLSLIVFYVFGRYRYPLVPVLMLLAAGGIAAWRETPAPAIRRRAVAAVVVAAVLAYLPLVNTRVDRMAHYVNIANAFLTDPGKWDQSAAFYEKALRESPRSAAAHFGMGTLQSQRHRTADAIAHYQVAVEGWPDNAELRLNFATALVEAGDNPHALDQLDRARGASPGRCDAAHSRRHSVARRVAAGRSAEGLRPCAVTRSEQSRSAGWPQEGEANYFVEGTKRSVIDSACGRDTVRSPARSAARCAVRRRGDRPCPALFPNRAPSLTLAHCGPSAPGSNT